MTHFGEPARKCVGRATFSARNPTPTQGDFPTMKVIRRPSPALVVSIVALVMSCGGTAAAAAHFLITNSKQIKDGAVTGADVRDGSIRARDLAAGAIPRATADGGTATEAFRKTGPELSKGGEATVATLDLPAGAYAIFSKVN